MIVLLVIAVVLLLGLVIKRQREDAYFKGFWAGKLNGWQSCEDMVISRAGKNPTYSEKNVLEDLLQ